MAKGRFSNIPFVRGRRTGPDAIVSRDEQWAANARETNPLAVEWYISTFPFHANDAVGTSGALGAALQVNLLPPLSGVLELVTARITIHTADSGKHIRACIYRYDSSQGKKQFVKVPSSEVLFDVSSDTKSGAPLDVPLDGAARLVPGHIYFVGTRSNSGTVRIPAAVTSSVSPFPSFQYPVPDKTLPGRIDIEAMSKTYDGFVPWVSYLSIDAKNLL